MVINFPTVPAKGHVRDSFEARSSHDPRYIFARRWKPALNNLASTSKIRWVFDRRTSRIAFLQIRDEGSPRWVDGTPEEVLAVEKDLNEGEAGYLVELDRWDLFLSCELPFWTGSALRQDEFPPILTPDPRTGEAVSNVYRLDARRSR